MRRLLLAAALLLTVPAMARDSLGIWNAWGAFADAGVPRCYAIAMAETNSGRSNAFQPYFTVGTWPRRGARGEIHVRLSRRVGPGGTVTLSVAGQRFPLVAGAADAWAQDQRMDAAIVAAMRSASTMTVSARAASGGGFSDSYSLGGAASAMDAAMLGCAQN
jgi:Invasion associated locus B (IalB) protein